MPKKDDIIYGITREDLQCEALEKMGRELTEEEIHIAKKGLDSGIGSSLDIVYETIFSEMI